jgi:hypothetical protein
MINEPATHQEYINDVLFDYLYNFYMAYLDNILIHLEEPLKHDEHVYKVLNYL